MGTSTPNYTSIYNLLRLRGLRRLIRAVIIGVISTLNLQVCKGYARAIYRGIYISIYIYMVIYIYIYI